MVVGSNPSGGSMKLIVVAAMGWNRAIGFQGHLPWGRLDADMKKFRFLTIGHAVIMGRKTFDSLPQPLAGRTNIIVTSSARPRYDGVIEVSSFGGGVEYARYKRAQRVFAAGGASVYEAALPIAEEMELTLVHESFAADTFFPTFHPAHWSLISSVYHHPDDHTPFALTFYSFRRRLWQNAG